MQKKVVDLLIEEGIVNKNLTLKALEQAEKDKVVPLKALLEKKLVSDEAIARATAYVLGVNYVDLRRVKADQDILKALPYDVAKRTMMVPLGKKDGMLIVAVLDATNIQSVDYLTTLTGQPVRTVMTSEEGVAVILSQYKSDFSAVNKAAEESSEEEIEKEDTKVKVLSQDSAISKALTTILEYAAKSKASDIHIEPMETELIIRCRIDGVLREVMNLPKSIESSLVTRVKILANLKIDEHRIPQDGQFAVSVAGREIDLRIAISPVVWGEQVVIRLLDKTGTTMDVAKMGMTGDTLRTVMKGIAKPNGMILTSGPTGSGKSTTLYALIKQIKNESINIVTLEDPVEYKMPGVNQIQVNVDAGLTFASGLRSILRQDPDVVMVGEIRDAETANLAVQAALTGHLVLSTLHTNSAAGILPRLLDMGVEPFLIASMLNVVIGQRLVRRVADARETYTANDIEKEEINQIVGDILPKSQAEVAEVSDRLGYPGLPLAGQDSYTLVKGVDGRETPGGYKGRAGLYESIDIDEDIQKLVVARATANEIMKVAREKGTITMRQDGVLKALSGITTITEVNRVASDLA